MKKVLSLLIVSVFVVTFIGCERVEKGREGIKESRELKDKINKDIQGMQKTGKEIAGEEEKKPAEPAEKEK